MGYDVIVVGAGSAGCVLAARLSENPNRSVLLLEAGPDYPELTTFPPEILSSLSPAYSHDWEFYSKPNSTNRSIHLPRAKIVGGCSATNATFALRGTPEDYDEWEAQGNSGWSFAEVLPFFRRLENDLDFDDEWHGREGPLPIRRYSPEELTSLQRAFLQACSAAGYAEVYDHNSPNTVGAGPLPMNAVNGIRQSSALVYLAPARSRSNLTVRSGVLVDRVLFKGHRAVGVHTAEPEESLWADHIVLSAGTYGSPALLMRSGLGPADHLRDLEIGVLENLPGVGQNLMDHPLLELRFTSLLATQPENIPRIQTLLTLKSAISVRDHDLHIFPESIIPTDPVLDLHRTELILNLSVVKPKSRGWLGLRTSSPAVNPLIVPSYLSHPDDMSRMLQAVHLARCLVQTAPLSDLDLQELYPEPRTSDKLAALEAVIRARVVTYSHPTGTCRMGQAKEMMAVVNSRGRVHGIDGLSVVDASIMPTIPAANTNLPTLMLSERCVDWLIEDL